MNYFFLLITLLAASGYAVEYQMTMDEVYKVDATKLNEVVEGKYMPLRQANFTVKAKDNSYCIMNALYCDTPDLCHANTKEKMKSVFVKWIKNFEGDSVEGINRVVAEVVGRKDGYGFETVVVDKKYEKQQPEPGQFMYLKLIGYHTGKESFLLSMVMVNDKALFENETVLSYSLMMRVK